MTFPFTFYHSTGFKPKHEFIPDFTDYSTIIYFSTNKLSYFTRGKSGKEVKRSGILQVQDASTTISAWWNFNWIHRGLKIKILRIYQPWHWFSLTKTSCKWAAGPLLEQVWNWAKSIFHRHKSNRKQLLDQKHLLLPCLSFPR